MSLGRLGAMCGCGTGQTCTDCQAHMPGLAGRASWATPTNYDPTLHRRYAYPGMGEVMIGSSGWTLGDVASLALVVLAGMSVWKGMNGRR